MNAFFRPPSTQTPVTIELWHAAASRDRAGHLERYCEQFLHSDETETANRFRVASARNQHVVGRAMARILLAGDDHDPKQIHFGRLEQGKPIVAQPAEATRPFNIAHTSGMVMCGLCRSGNDDPWLGVDVEAIDRRTDPALADRYFSPLEVEQITRVSDNDAKRLLFLKIWTLKEAFIKAIGTGLRTPLDQFAFVDAQSESPRLVLLNPSLSHDRIWQCQSLQPRPGFIAAVAIGHRVAAEDSPSPEPINVQLSEFHPT